MSDLKWTKIPGPVMPRSSHTLSVVNNKAYIFGGEIVPRKPVDNAMHVVDLETGEYTKVEGKGAVPEARVGHTAAVIGQNVYIFGGRGGGAMTPLEESSCLHRFTPSTSTWTRLNPSSGSLGPCPRSYHCSTASPTHIFVHSGCGDASTGRLGDTWAYDIASNAWAQLADAPGDTRGGSSVAWFDGRVYRFGGFNGKTEVGGEIDVLDLSEGHIQEAKWSTISFGETAGLGREGDDQLQGDSKGPGARSVCGLHPLARQLVTLFGEGKPSPTGGHDAAGNFWGDVWAFDPSTREWKEVKEGKEGEGREGPGERGWFASDAQAGRVVLWGGLDAKNERLGDGWILSASGLIR